MSYSRLLQPKINPFGLFIYFPKKGAVDLKTFSDKVISLYELNKYKEKGAYCNSYNDLFISEGKEFWIVNNTTFSIKRKTTPIDKNEHSMIFLPSLTGTSKVFLIGGTNKKTFYYDLKKNYFINWAETNELHIKPCLIKIEDYLYIFDGFKNVDICFERTKLSENEKKWEKIVPNFDNKIISNFPSKSFATALDMNGNVIFLGGDNITLENKNSFVYDIKNNKITLSLKGTNDNMTFDDKNFYKINNKYNVALPYKLNESKELAAIDKDEQSLIKINIELPIKENEIDLEYRNNSDYNNNTFNVCKYCQNSYKSNQSSNQLKYNMKYAQYSHPQIKKRNFYDIQIKEEPKEFGYFISSNSSVEAKLKAKNDQIKVVPFHKNYKSIIKPNQTTFKVSKKPEENINDNFGVYQSGASKFEKKRNPQLNINSKSKQVEKNYYGNNRNVINQGYDDNFNVVIIDQTKKGKKYTEKNPKQQNQYQNNNEDVNVYYSNSNKQNINNSAKNNKIISKNQDYQKEYTPNNPQGQYQSKKFAQQINSGKPNVIKE